MCVPFFGFQDKTFNVIKKQLNEKRSQNWIANVRIL